MIMTGMTTFDKTLDMQGSGKLKEFRGLRTKIPNVYFAKGAPLHTVHLPNTITTLELIENGELTNIITDKSIVNNICVLDENGVAQYADPITYRGLYLEDITLVNAKIGELKPENKKRIGFFGDSITCGYGNTERHGEGFTMEHEEFDRAYPFLIAQKLDMDYMVVARSGVSVSRQIWIDQLFDEI